MKRSLLLLTLLVALIAKTKAQTANATWALTSNQNATSSGSISAASQMLQGLNHYDYITGGERTIPPGNAWPADVNANPSRYMEYAVAPTAGNILNVSKILVSLSFNGSGTGRVNLSWSTDKINFTPVASNLVLNSASTPTAYTFDNLNINIHDGDTLYFRISPWTTGVVTSKYLIAKNIQIIGSTTPAPQVTWPLTTNQTATATGTVSAVNQKLNNLVVNNYISGNGGQRILPPSHTWPAESAPNNTRFIEYKISPISFNELTIKEINIPLSFNSSSSGHAKIAWSTDSINFTNLTADVAIAAGSVPVNHQFGNLTIKVALGKSLYLRVYPWTTSVNTDKYLVSKNVTVKLQTDVAQQIAFPTAEGGGRNALGARGGQIYYVTNLNNSGAGSLRDAVSAGNRTILFKTSGTIFLQSPIVLLYDNVTIAGQTAPGDGICLANYGLNIRANDIIIRHLRSRPGDVITVPGDSSKMVDAMYNSFGNPITNPFRNIIVDHCSLSWSTDEAASFYAIADFTLQWSIISESLYRAAHPKPTPHGYGGIWGGQNASFHHNLLASHSNRNPRFSGSENNGQPELEYVDFRNNVIFNWYGGTYGGIGGHQNMVNNYYKSGPATAGTFRKRRILSYSNTTAIPDGKFYINGNYVYGFSDVTTDNWEGVELASGILIDSVQVNSPFTHSPVETQSAEEAYTSVLGNAGAFLPRRDTVDRRVVKEVSTGVATYSDTSFSVSGMVSPSGIIDSQNTVGGWPALSSTLYPNDSDNDGLPDWWEAKQNGNTTDSTSVNRNNYDSDGYTFLERYINNIPGTDDQIIFDNINGYRLNGGDTVKIDFNINWAKNQFRFDLYRSTDNINFTKINQVNSNINKTNYSFTDISSSTTLYYKVASVNTNSGDILFSDIISIAPSEMALSQNLLSFKIINVNKTNRTLELVWDAPNDLEIQEFTIERKSNDGLFNVINKIPSTQKVFYSTVDNNLPDGLTYYRLKINDVNGKESYSEIISTNTLTEDKLQLFPNPAEHTVSVKHQAAKVGSGIIITDMNGKTIKNVSVDLYNTLSTIAIADIPPGNYVLIFNNISEQQNIKFIKK